jgi:uncharacterized repeat protein (TIGR02059 family)
VPLKKALIIAFLVLSTIASATDYYVSSAGNDNNTGLSSSMPWKTITKVNSAFSIIKPNDRILFNRGDTFYGTMTVTKSGNAGNPITIGAYGNGDNPIITGFTTITGWTNEGSGIYSTSIIPVGYDSYPMVNMVTLNDTVKAMGRWPDKGYLNYESHTNSPAQSITDNQLTDLFNWTGGEIVLRKYRWVLDRQDITNHSNTVIAFNALKNYGDNSVYNPVDKNGYFIQGHLNTLDKLGEWYWEKSKNKLYMYFGVANPTSYVVKASIYDKNIHLQDRAYINFENIDCEGGNTQGIYMFATDNITFSNCNLTYQGGNGYYSNFGKYIELSNCYITNSLNNGIFFENENSNVIINGISITNAGTIPGAARSGNLAAMGMGVIGTNIQVSNCKVINTGYNGIYFSGSNILIENNYVDNFCTVKDDGGGIYTYSGDVVSVNRIVRNNIILNTKGAYPGCEAYASYEAYGKACGIYMDERSQNVEISGNTVVNCSWAGIVIHKAKNIDINNNNSYNNANGQILFVYEATGEVENIISTGNKFISKTVDQPTYFHRIHVNENPNVTGTFDNNYYSRPINDHATIHVYLNNLNGNDWKDQWYTLAEWQTYTGEDANSHKSNVTTTDTTGFFKFICNPTTANKTTFLDTPMIDVDGTKYINSITLLPYSSAILMLDPNPSTLPVNPVYVNSTIENATPTIVGMTYDLTLANIIPSASAFSVKVNSVARTVNTVAISGSRVLLTLSNPVVYGDLVTISYTMPSTNPLQTTSGGQAATLNGLTVVNNVSPANLLYVNSVIQNSTPNTLEISYNLSLAILVPASSAFTVTVNSVARTVSTVSISGTKVLLTLSNPVVSGDVITVSYSKPATNPIQTSSGGMASNLNAKIVTNNVNPGISPVYVSSVVENTTPNTLEMTYSLSLANIVPATSTFTVTVNSVARTVSTVSISGTKVLLTLSNPVVSGDVITVSYSMPGNNPIQTSSGGLATDLNAKTVTNNVNPGISPVYVSSVVENTTPNTLEMTYSLSLANIVPATSTFTVTVNSVARSVNAVSISVTKVLLTLASPVVNGDIVTVLYTKPVTNTLQTPSGGQAATISAQSVTNNISNPANLEYINSAIGNSSPTLLEINYNLALANVLPAASAFIVSINSVNRNVNSITISGSSIVLTLAAAVVYGDVVTVAYNKPAKNQLQSTSGLQAATMGAQSVTNKVDPVGPIYVSSAIENITPGILELTFNEPLDLTAPGVSAFVVIVNGVKREVTLVSISGNRVLLTLASQVVYGDNVTVSYIKPATNQLKKATGEIAVSFSFPQPVTNKLAKNLNKKGNISIYPNPAREFVNISIIETSMESQILKIFDLSGKLCMESQLIAGINNKILINIKSGIYIVQVVSGSAIKFVQKLIVL